MKKKDFFLYVVICCSSAPPGGSWPYWNGPLKRSNNQLHIVAVMQINVDVNCLSNSTKKKKKRARNPEVYRIEIHVPCVGFRRIQANRSLVCSVEMFSPVWLGDIQLRLALCWAAAGRHDGHCTFSSIVFASRHLTQDDQCSSPGVCDGSLVCCLPHRHPTQGKSAWHLFCSLFQEKRELIRATIIEAGVVLSMSTAPLLALHMHRFHHFRVRLIKIHFAWKLFNNFIFVISGNIAQVKSDLKYI